MTLWRVADKKIPSWPPPVTPQPYRTGSVWWRSQSSVPGGLGRSFHSGPQRSAGEQQTVGWQRPVLGLWRSSRPREEGTKKTWCVAALFWIVWNWRQLLEKSHYLVEERHSSVHVASLLLVVAGSLHHVLRVTEQGQVHQLVIQAVLLSDKEMHRTESEYKMHSFTTSILVKPSDCCVSSCS